VNSLAQTVLKIAVPGIADFYQGGELWDLSLVDPDNRRPVDLDARAALLRELNSRIDAETPHLEDLCAELLAHWADGRVKLYVTYRGLGLRRERAQVFRRGAYQPLTASGERAAHVVALARGQGSDVVVTVVPRLSARLTDFAGRFPLGQEVWGDTWIGLDEHAQAGMYRDHLSGLTIATEMRDSGPVLPVGAILRSLPVAMLVREAPEP